MLSTCRAYLARRGFLATPAKVGSGRAEVRPTASVTMQDLPNELLGSICDYLRDEKSDLHALCLTSNFLNGAATPLLYGWFLSDYDTSRLHKLVRTLSKHRDLSKHLKDIVLYTNLDADAIKPSRPELITLLEAILPIAACDGWLHTKLAAGLREGVYNVKAILLLLLAERVETITIVPLELTMDQASSPEMPLQYRFDVLVAGLIRLATVSQGAQKALARVHTMHAHAPEDGHPLAFPAQFMALPSMNILCATFAFSPEQAWPNCVQHNSSITRLHLDLCMLSTAQVAVIVKTCHSLIELGVIWDDLKLKYGLDSGFEVDVTRLDSALLQHSQTLKTLRLVFLTENVDVRHSDFHGALSSLSAFTALKELELDECLVFGNMVEWLIQYWSPMDAIDSLEGFLPETLDHFTFRTRKDPMELLPVLVFMSTILPASLKSLDMHATPTAFRHPAVEDSAEAHFQRLLQLDADCSSVYITQLETGSFSGVKSELQFCLRHDDGVHAAIEDIKSVNDVAEMWKLVERMRDGDFGSIAVVEWP